MNETHGLLSSEAGSIPLMGVKVEGGILGRGARVKVSQVFRNREDKSIEAVYKFPLPEGAAVCGFRAFVEGKKIQGLVEERDRAFVMYDDALSRGDGGYLLDEERPNIFTLSVGGLNPGAEVTIEIEYVTLLDVERQQVRFFLPTTISPRYIPDNMNETYGIPEDSTLHPSYAKTVPYGLSVSLDIHGCGLLKSVNSPSHSVETNNMKDDPVKVSFSRESVSMDRDFILDMEFEKSFESRAYFYREGRESFMQLDLLLKGDAPDKASRDVIFVLDCSGSMAGDSIREAKRALGILLRGLDPATAFTIYRFGSDYECLYEKSEKYTPGSLEDGLTYLKETDADLGGTEIIKPLKKIYAALQETGNREADIVLLTDGEVANEEQIFEMVRNNQGSTRLFAIGIGAGCNEYFIKGLARSGRGASEFIYPGERIEPKVLRLFSKITQHGLMNPEIHWGQGVVEQAPVNPAIFLGNPVTLFARCSDKNFSKEKVTVRGRINGQGNAWEIDIIESESAYAPVSILWARERIRDLEESGDALGGRDSRQEERRANQWKETILALSKKYNILSQITSYVAIEQREEQDETTGQLVLRRIPVPITTGWHGISSVCDQRQDDVLYDTVSDSFVIEEDMVFHEAAFDSLEADYDVLPKLKAAPDDKTDMVLSILSLQRAEGGMVLNERVAFGLGIDYKQLLKMSSDVESDMEIDGFLFLSTAILLKTLEILFSSERGTWVSIVKKSADWMKYAMNEAKPILDGKDLMVWAEEFVRNNVRA